MKLDNLPQIGLTFVFVAVVIVAGFLALGGLTEDTACSSGYEWNESANYCHTATNVSDTAGATFAGNASSRIQSGMDNITDYASTWGTILGVAVLLGIVIFGFAFGRGKGWF